VLKPTQHDGATTSLHKVPHHGERHLWIVSAALNAEIAATPSGFELIAVEGGEVDERWRSSRCKP
jgi:hypothetical protein